MTREEAAAILKRSVEELNDVLDGVTMSEGTEATIRRDIDAYSMAVDALLEKVEVPDIHVGKSKPLTLDDLKRSVKFGYPVWLVGMEDGDGLVFIHHVDSCSVRYARVGDSNEWCFRTKSYGVRVFAYLDGPKEEQRDSD